MASAAVSRARCGGGVYLDLGGMVVVVAIEVSCVTSQTVATVAAIHCCVAVAVDPYDASAIGIGVTGKAIVLVDSSNGIAGVAIDTER